MPSENIIVGRDSKDLLEYGDKGTVYIGKHIVGVGEEAHLTNPVRLDVTKPHIVLIAGKRGSGKCLHGDTIITFSNGKQIPIKDLENNTNKVLGLNNELKISKLHKEGFYKRKVKELLYIKTRSGKEIKLTPEHPLLTIKGWKNAEDVGIGGRIATPRKLVSSGNIELEDCKIKLLAYLIAEGMIKRKTVRFTNMDNEIVKDFNDSIKDFDENLRIVKYRRGSYGISHKNERLYITKIRDKRGFVKRNTLKAWLKDMNYYDLASIDKYIPKIIFSLSKNKLSLFLNRLFSCDGNIYKHKTTHGYVWEISYSTSSKQMAHQIQNLILRFGILSRIRRKKVKCNNKHFISFEIVIGTENTIRFIKNIGFFGEKQNREKICLNESRKIKRNTNIDTIPKELWDIYRPKNWAEVGRGFGFSVPKSMRESIRYSPSRQKLIQIAKYDQNDIIRTIANSDIFWDEIVYMELLEGDFWVYDISIPEFHNFIANDIIVHNSYSACVIGEEITLLPKEIKNNLSVLMIDTMGIFWSMGKPNERDAKLLKQWDLEPKGMDVSLFVPKKFTKEYGEAGVKKYKALTLPCGELTAMDWNLTFRFEPMDEYGLAVERIIKKVRKEHGDTYSIDTIVAEIAANKSITKKVKNALTMRFEFANDWGVFEKTGTDVKNLFEKGKVTIVDVSRFPRTGSGWGVRSMVVGMLGRKILQYRMEARKGEEFQVMGGEAKNAIPMVWIIVDEAHNFVGSSGETAATESMLSLLKEGRQPGISQILITQMPNKLHPEALAQSDIVISHRLTAESDINALRSIMQTYVLKDIQELINTLPRRPGSAIILDDNSERLYSAQVRPRLSWHAGGSPSAIKKKGLFD
ncbi:MAG: hypothetical protein ISS36_04415 [Candidatus Aenigmarchaeota archaeon]|nr:hypothetical protein [Candidatus Aenigmarchaeota archaeon]